MQTTLKKTGLLLALACISSPVAIAQKNPGVRVVKDAATKKVDIWMADKLFTSFLYPDSLEKPVLYPVFTATGKDVTRGFPMNPKAGDPTDHPHHIGIWFNWENLNGLDFWNNSYAIPKEKKSQYGWIKTDRILQASSGKIGILSYHANWTNDKNEVLVEENTHLAFSMQGSKRIIDRVTVLKANTEATFTDAKDGMYAIRLAHELQIPSVKDEKFTDSKGIVTIVKGGTDKIAGGNYFTSEGKLGDAAWSTRANWCKAFGKMGNDSVTVAIIDHPANINYPTFWHARGYGLFAANPLGEKIFTNGKSEKNLKLQKGESVTFRFRVVVDEGSASTSMAELRRLAEEFSREGR